MRGPLRTELERSVSRIHMKSVTDFIRNAAAKILRAFDFGPTWGDDLPSEHTAVEQLNRVKERQRENQYAMRGVPDQAFVEAKRWLEELLRIVSHELERQPEGTLHYDQCYDPEDPENGLLYGESRPIRMPKSLRKVWLKIGQERSSRGYRPVKVIDGPLPTHMAIFAALTALQAETTSEEDLKVLLPIAESDQPESHPVLLDFLQNEGIEKAVDAYVSARLPTKFAYAKSLLRYYRPGFDELPTEERRALIERTCRLVNEYRSALHKLLAFAEYGMPGKKIILPSENVDRDIQAAVLVEVEGLSHAEVGEELGIDRVESDEVHGGNTRVAKMVKRGKDILEKAWGKEGWWEQVLRLRTEREQWAEGSKRASTGAELYLRVLERLEGKELSSTELALPIDWREPQLHFREHLIRRLRTVQTWALKAQANARRQESELVRFREEVSSFFEAGIVDHEALHDLDQAIEAARNYSRFVDKCLTNPFLLQIKENGNDK